MLVRPDQILPSQDYLKPQTVKFILECIRSRDLEKLPPAPIVRKDSDDNLITIDGHNLIAVKMHLNEEVDVHIAASDEDGLPTDSEVNISRNKNLKEKFDTVIEDRVGLQKSGINSFKDLLARYERLFD
jgi:hypothetical protein